TNNLVVLGAGSNIISSPNLIVGGRKEAAILTMKPGGVFILNNGASRADFSVGNDNVNTAQNTTNLCDLSGGAFQASLSNLVVGLKAGGGNGNCVSTMLMSSSPDNNVDVNSVTVGSLAAAASGGTVCSGSLTFSGGNFLVNSNVNLASFSGL